MKRNKFKDLTDEEIEDLYIVANSSLKNSMLIQAKFDKIKKYCDDSSFDVFTKEYGLVTVCDSNEIKSILEVN